MQTQVGDGMSTGSPAEERGWTANVSVSRVTALADGGLEGNCRTKALRDSNKT